MTYTDSKGNEYTVVRTYTGGADKQFTYTELESKTGVVRTYGGGALKALFKIKKDK